MVGATARSPLWHATDWSTRCSATC
jgi:hypothetical protein